MIYKHGDYQNGYIFGPNSSDEEFQEICNRYDQVKCIICNRKTSKNFRLPKAGYSPITINNKIADGCFFINSIK